MLLIVDLRRGKECRHLFRSTLKHNGKEKWMAKKKDSKLKPTLRKMIEYMKLDDNEEIIIHTYSKQTTTEPICVKDVEETLLKKKIIVVQPKHGGKEHNYNCFMFVVE